MMLECGRRLIVEDCRLLITENCRWLLKFEEDWFLEFKENNVWCRLILKIEDGWLLKIEDYSPKLEGDWLLRMITEVWKLLITEDWRWLLTFNNCWLLKVDDDDYCKIKKTDFRLLTMTNYKNGNLAHLVLNFNVVLLPKSLCIFRVLSSNPSNLSRAFISNYWFQRYAFLTVEKKFFVHVNRGHVTIMCLTVNMALLHHLQIRGYLAVSVSTM